MRPGHNWSGSLEKGFEPNPEVHRMLLPIPQRQLVHENRTQGEAPGVGQPLRRHLPMPIEDPFELLVEVLNRDRAQLVEDPPHFHPIVGMWVAPRLRRHQTALVLLTLLTQRRRIVVLVAQDEAHLSRDATQQAWRNLTIGYI